jgi:four helix bundle protein
MTIIEDPVFRAWEQQVRPSLREDPLWSLHSYRVAMFALQSAQDDVAAAARRGADPAATAQLLRALGSVCANVAEAFGRPTATDRSRFLSYAIGSVREAISWYHALARHLASGELDRRLDVLSELRRLLLGYLRWLRTHAPRLRLA